MVWGCQLAIVLAGAIVVSVPATEIASVEPIEEPLAVDDECQADEPGSLCGLNALQLRASQASEKSSRGWAESLEQEEGPAHPAVCDATLVAETCERVNLVTREYYGTVADKNPNIVHAAELAEQLMVSRKSILDFLEHHLAATNVEVDKKALSHEAFGVECMDLCNLTVLSFPESYRPATSDVGCYVPTGSSVPKCDIDVSPTSLGGFHFNDHDPREGESKYSESPNRKDDQAAVHLHPNTTAELKALEASNYPAKSMKQLGIAVANLFRVYPLSPIRVMDSAQGHSEKAEADLQVDNDEHENIDFDPVGYWDDLVEEDSDDPASLLEGTTQCQKDTGGTCAFFGCHRWRNADCRSMKCVCGGNKCSNFWGQCVSPQDVASSSSIDTFAASLVRRRRDPSLRRRRWKQTFGVPGGVPSGTVDKAHWKDNAKQVGVKAQAYAAGALRNMNAGYEGALMLKWFGRSDAAAQREMRRVINGVHDMLSNVDYIYPGSRCQANVYAYVFPNPPYNKNKRGQYVVQLCDLYLKSDLEEQIETLTHEGSHHHAMSTNDVCYTGDGPGCTRAYGRQICASLAKKDPNKALKNADNFCYFINDAYESCRGSCRTPSPAPPPPPNYQSYDPPWMRMTR